MGTLQWFRCVCVCVFFAVVAGQTVKGGISETRIEKRIVITGDADIDHDEVFFSFLSSSLPAKLIIWLGRKVKPSSDFSGPQDINVMAHF